MSHMTMALIIGAMFGAGLVLSSLADPDKIIGTLRLKDLHAMRTIAVFVLVGMVGTMLLDMAGLAHFSVKPAALISVLIGGTLLGVGFGLTGYCPGTGLACAAAGRIDAFITVLGMFAGALVFILIYPHVVVPIEKIANYGKVTLPEITGLASWMLVVPIAVIGSVVLYITRPKK